MLNSLRGTTIKGKTINIKLLIYFNTHFVIVHGAYTGTAWVTLKLRAGGSPRTPLWYP